MLTLLFLLALHRHNFINFLGDSFASHFLLKNGALSTTAVQDTGYTPLHLLAAWRTSEVVDVATMLLKQGSGPNAVAADGW